MAMQRATLKKWERPLRTWPRLKLTNPDSEIMGIGIGAPNGNYYSGTIEYAPNLSFKGIVHLVELMRAEFPEYQYVALTNDAMLLLLVKWCMAALKA